jgi:hypothetical protein
VRKERTQSVKEIKSLVFGSRIPKLQAAVALEKQKMTILQNGGVT